MAKPENWAGQTPVSIGAILNQAFGTITDNPLATLGTAFLIGALPVQVVNYLNISYQASALATGSSGGTMADPLMLGSAVAFVIAILCSLLAQAALVHATTAYAEGRRASIGEGLAVGLSVALPLLGLSLMMTVGIVGGVLLFLVPGIILFLMWSVAVPALVDEKLGVMEALGRSRTLTKGFRWKILGLELVMLIIAWIVEAIIGVLIFMTGGGLSILSQIASGSFPFVYLLFSVGAGTFVTAFWSTAQSSLFLALRETKDGPQSDALVDVFS